MYIQKIGAAVSSESSVMIYQTTQHHIETTIFIVSVVTT
jgi:hypothetical protein